jgi:hypothetical protein
MADAEAMIDDSFRIKKLRKQKLPFDCIELFAASAVVRVAKAERADASARPAAMLTARAACKTAIECARLMPLWLPEALRTQGNLSWLEGKAIDARKHWHESLIVAERSAFPIERGLTLMDQGLRLGDAALLTDAAQLFREAGALKYLAMAQPDDPGVLKAVAVAAEPASVA